MKETRWVRGFALLAGVLLAAGQARAGGGPAEYRAVSAMPGAPLAVEGTLSKLSHSPTQYSLRLWETWKSSGERVTRYDPEMTKRLHLILVSDDFVDFQHVHPALHPDGTFTIDVAVPRAARYEIYADAQPHGAGRQVLRFANVPFGSLANAAPELTATPPRVAAGPYEVTLSSLRLLAGSTTMLGVKVTKNGKPAADLHPYLGGAAHAVFLNGSDLSYVHVHPMQGTDMSMDGMDGMKGMGSGDMEEMRDLPASARVEPAMMLHVRVREKGIYKLWFQFRGGGALYVAPFVLTAV